MTLKVNEPISNMPTDYKRWIPWQPKIGDKVRVRLRGECPYSNNKKFAMEGHIGVVLSVTYIDNSYPYRSIINNHHNIQIEFIGPLPVGCDKVKIYYGHYCEIELEPVEKGV